MAHLQSELTEYFTRLLNPALFEDYAPNGLQVEGKTHLKRLAFAVSATQDSIKKSIKWGADGLVVHHGIFWKHQGARTVTGAWGERVKVCIKNDLNLFAYHLPLDAHPEVGNAATIAKEMGLKNIAPFAILKKQPLGVKAELAQPVRASEFQDQLKKYLGHNVVLASPDETKLIRSLGIITGGANNEWVESMKENLDAFLTGEISEYNWHDSIEAGVHFFAGGHHATERPGIKALMTKVKTDFPALDVTFFDSDNPV